VLPTPFLNFIRHGWLVVLVLLSVSMASCSGSATTAAPGATATPVPESFVEAVSTARAPSATATSTSRPRQTPTARLTVTVTRPAPAKTPRPSATATATALPTTLGGYKAISAARLPKEARQTLALIDRGGPFPYRQDGVVFQNREDHLPRQRSGYYHEYTVVTPGSPDRGARRIITGAGGEFYYTADHYDTFLRVIR
jgi:ribonuclease T1